MKLYFVCLALSLVSLASADLSAEPIATFLYSAGKVIGKGFDLRYLDYRHYTDAAGNNHIISFNAAGNDSLAVNPYMVLHKNYTDLQVSGIAVESYQPRDGYKPDEHLCRERTSEKLRHLVQSCYANILLRELTEAEKQELKEFDQIEPMEFKLVYKRKNILAQMGGIDYFNMKNFVYYGQSNLNMVTNPFKDSMTSMRLNGMLDDKSFIIENQPTGLTVDCMLSSLDDLKLVDCHGEIWLRKAKMLD